MRSLIARTTALTLALTCASHASTPPSIAPLTTNAAPETPTSIPANRIPMPMDKPINQLTWGTTHNSFAYYTGGAGDIITNQSRRMSQQMNDGIGGLMLDLHSYQGRAWVCHEGCSSIKNAKIFPLSAWLNDDILPFLKNNPDAVLTIFFESYVEPELLKAEFQRSPDLAKMTFNPDTWPNSGTEWPTIKQLLDKGQRLLLFTDKSNNAGTHTFPGGSFHVMHDRNGISENHYGLGDWVTHDNWDCTDHKDGKPALNDKFVRFPGKSWPKLFLMNHFHAWTVPLHAGADNNNSKLWNRVENKCLSKTGRRPNFIAVDYYEQGDVLDYAATLSHGGIVLWEGNNATQDIVCTIPYTGAKRSINFKSGGQFINGCENDEARSATLLNLKAGSTISLFDNPNGSREDDWASIEVLKDIKSATINTFEKNVSTPEYVQWSNRNNGLDGKVSRATLGYNDSSMIVFHEGNNMSQNIVCTIDWTHDTASKSVNFQNDNLGCDNDEARSATLYNIKKNTRMGIYDSPDGSHSDDFVEIVTHRDIKRFTLPSFEKSTSNSDYTTRYFRKNGLDGKVSRFIMYDMDKTAPVKKVQR